MPRYVIFDLETVPDLDAARRLLGLGPEVGDDAVRMPSASVTAETESPRATCF